MEPDTRGPRLFTLDEANALLPQVERLVKEIQARAAQLAELQERLESFRQQKRAGEHVVAGEAGLVQDALGQANRISADLRAVVEELLALGCELKDIPMGLVDFRTQRDGRTVYLCWRLGEDAIRYWHELDTGFASRRPL